MFDYSTDENMQCTLEEVRVGRCTPKYSFIGARYENIFPLKEIIENNEKKEDKKNTCYNCNYNIIRRNPT